MHIYDLIPPGALAQALKDGYVRERSHPSDELRILNYAEKAAYERHWDEVTTQCRGLIVDRYGQVVARCLPKFFNYGEHDGERMPVLDLGAEVEVTDKLDGSLGVSFRDVDGRMSVATRGSFQSEQAQWATKHYREKYEGKWEPIPGLTYLWEIIYPTNRIVLDYSGMEDLVLICAVDINTGEIHGPSGFVCLEWPGPLAKVMVSSTLAEALALPPRDNAEGLVVRYVEDGMMTKIKQIDYVNLHKIVTGLNEITVWESLVEGTYEQLIEKVPDEFHDWLREKAAALTAVKNDIQKEVEFIHDALVSGLPEDYTKKDFALRVAQVEVPKFLPSMEVKAFHGLIFSYHAGRDLNTSRGYWKYVRPRGDTFMKSISEDVA